MSSRVAQVDAFLSYTTPNRAVADAIRTALEGAGLACWMATEAIREGGDWAAQIPPAISACKVFVLVLSRAASESAQVAREVHLAMQERKRLIVYRIDASEPAGALQYFLAGMHRIDAPENEPRSRIGDLLERTRRALHEDEAEVAPDLAAPVPNNLPPAKHALVGRENDISELAALIREQRLVTVVGTGGVGKTSLAIQAARSVLGSFPDGVFYIELASITEPGLVEAAMASALPAEPQASCLVLMDNCEHVLAAAAECVKNALAAHASLHVVATSRAALRLSGERVVALAPLPIPKLGGDVPTIAELNASPAARLFLQRASAISQLHLDVDSERAAVRDICARLDGVPLAIELAAARAGSLSLTQIASAIDQRFRLLTKGPRDSLAHHQTLSALIDWSFNLLTAGERSVYEKMGAFPGRFTIEDLSESVCSDVDTFDLVDIVESLIEQSLLFAAGTVDAMKQYDLLESLRAYLRGRLEQSNAYVALGDAVARRGIGLAQLAARSGNGVHVLNGNFDNVRFALSRFSEAEGDVQLAAETTVALTDLLISAGRWADGHHWTQIFLRDSERFPVSLRRSLLLSAAAIAGCREDYDAMISFCETALQLDRSESDRRMEARVRNSLAFARFHLGEFEAARSLWLETAKLLDLEQMPIQSAMVSKNLALIDQRILRDYDAAEKRCLAAFAVLNDERNALHAALALLMLSEIAYARQDHDAAHAKATHALQLVTSLGNRQYSADGNLLLAKIAFSSDSILAAANSLAEAISMYGDELGREVADCALLSSAMALNYEAFEVAAQLLAYYCIEDGKSKIPGLEPDGKMATRTEVQLRSALGPRAFGRATLVAQSMTRKDVARIVAGVAGRTIAIHVV